MFSKLEKENKINYLQKMKNRIDHLKKTKKSIVVESKNNLKIFKVEADIKQLLWRFKYLNQL